MNANPYETLGVSKTATAPEIKKAYRRLARSNHPDLHLDDPGADARFKAISAAHDLLKDPASRARFDAGEIDAAGAERPPRQYWRDFADAPDNPYQRASSFRSPFGGQGDPADMFAEMLRGHGARGNFADGESAAHGQDIRYALQVPFLDAACGADLHLTLADSHDISVKIPAGAQDGQTLRLRGQGQPGHGSGLPGDALITLSIGAHPVFRREGDDIHLTLPITIDEAILGGKVTAPTITGPVTLTIPAGTSAGRIMRLRGRGVVRAGHKTGGDQLVELRIVSPPVIDDALRDFLTHWRTTHPHNPRRAMLTEAAR